MKRILIILFLCICSMMTFAQKIDSADLKVLRTKEDSLKYFSFLMINSEDPGERMRCDSHFIKIMVRSLKIKNSFEFSFDSLQTVSKLVAPDSSFRIFTWHLVKDENYCRQKGVIQMKTTDGSMKIYPLRDVSEFTERAMDTIANSGGWIGAIYYRIIQKEHQGKKYYTLIGFDEHNARTTRKWIEVLSFNDRNEPVFGLKNVFSYAEDSIPRPSQNRFLLEYKNDGRARVQFDEEMDMILFDHLISETNEPEKKYTLIPDGDYEGFVWKNGQWMHIDKVFKQKLEDGQAPIPLPFKDKEQVVPPGTQDQ